MFINSFKDLDIMISELADNTSYDKDFLLCQYEELIHDGMTVEDAYKEVETISYKQDW